MKIEKQKKEREEVRRFESDEKQEIGGEKRKMRKSQG